MPRGTPDETSYRPEVDAEDLPRKLTPQMRDNISIAPGLDQLSSAVGQKYRADLQTYAGNSLADLRVGMTQSMEDLKTKAQPGAEGYTDQVLAAFDKASQGFTEKGGANSGVSTMMGPELNRMRAQYAQQAIDYQTQAGVIYRTQSAHDTVDKLATIASSHPEQAQDLTEQALKQVGGSQLGPDVTQQVAEYAKSTIARSAVEARISQDPYGTMSALLKPETADPVIQTLKPNERETLLQHADSMLHQRVADAERVESIQDKQERQAASSALTGLIVRSQSDTGLSIADVMKVAPVFRHDPAGLEAALNLASGKTVTTDVHTYLPLLQNALSGQDVSQEVMEHAGRDIDQSDAQRLLELSANGLPNAHKQGADTINDLFKQGLFDKYDLGFNARHSNALNDYYTWARATPNATPDQAVSQANKIAFAYNSNVAKATDTLDLPRFAVGGHTDFNPDATAAATAAAEKAGSISHADAVRQMSLIATWRAVIQRSQKSPKSQQSQQ